MYNEILNTLHIKSDKLNWTSIPHDKYDLISREYSTMINGSPLSLSYNKVEAIWFLNYLNFTMNSVDYPIIRNIVNIVADTLRKDKINKDAYNLLIGLKAL